jgi:hypothetical protein
MQFRLFFDGDGNGSYSIGEGIRGMDVFFLGADGSAVSGSATTANEGIARLALPMARQRIYIPYLGINMELARFPGRELHSLWLPRVALPDRVP